MGTTGRLTAWRLETWGPWALVLCLMLGVAGCGAAIPSSQPSSPVPLDFPTSIVPDVSKVTRDESSSNLTKTISRSGPLATAIAEGPEMAQAIKKITDEVLSFLDGLEITSSVDTTTFSGTATTPVTYRHIAETVEVKCSFTDFDFDNDGAREGCSGNSLTTPICVRCWIAGKRGLAGVFTVKPTSTNKGAGRIKMMTFSGRLASASSFDHVFAEDFRMAFDYDHQDSANLSTTLKGNGDPDGTDGNLSTMNGQARITVVGSDATTAIKTIKMAADMNDATTGFSFQQRMIGRWKEDANYWMGSTRQSGNRGFEMSDLTEVCAQISTGTQVESSNCSAITITGESFLDIPASSETAAPTDFPASPDF